MHSPRVSDPLDEYFESLVRRSLTDLQVPDDGAGDYLVGALARAAGLPRPASVAERLADIQRAWDPGVGSFDPRREVTLRRELGDHALVMTGFFWDALRERGTTRHHTRLGREAYRFVAEYHRALGDAEAALFRTLADRFTLYAGVLTYLREVYVAAPFEPRWITSVLV